MKKDERNVSPILFSIGYSASSVTHMEPKSTEREIERQMIAVVARGREVGQSGKMGRGHTK